MGGASGNQGGSNNSGSEMRKKSKKDLDVSGAEKVGFKSQTKDKKNVDKYKLNNYEVSNNTGSVVLNAATKLRQKMFETNRKHFQEKVLTSKNRGNYEDTFDSYSSYMESRLAGKTDAYGNTIYSNTNNDDPIKKVTETAPTATAVAASPTTAEVDQGTSTMMSDAEILVKNKKKARSPTILTRATGLGNSSLNTTKKTLGA